MNILSYALLFIQLILLFIGSYWLIISFFGLGKIPKIPQKTPKKRFLLLIPAHNEEKVIGNLLKNLTDIDYPKELYQIYVIADNCTDKTANIAKTLGINVLKHTSLPNEKKGKPYAIKYALDNLREQLDEFDAIAIFDADNLVTKNYLKEMNKHLLNGEKLIQCYLDTKNPNDTFITLGYATAYFYMNRAWQLAKYKLHLGNAIGGTGFCVDTNVIKKIGWTTRSLTEDLEFTMQCLLNNIKATWCHTARVYDEKPEKFNASCVQRLRWSRGHWDACFKYFGPLLLRAITKADRCAFDGVMYLLNPVKALLEAAMWVMWGIGVLVFKQSFFILFPIWVWGSFFIFSCVYVMIVLGIDTDSKFNRVKALLGMLFFNVSYIPLFFWALLTYKDKTWIRTEHVKSISTPPSNTSVTVYNHGVYKYSSIDIVDKTITEVNL